MSCQVERQTSVLKYTIHYLDFYHVEKSLVSRVTTNGHDTVDMLAMVKFFWVVFDLFNAKGDMTQAYSTSYYSIASYIPAVLM